METLVLGLPLSTLVALIPGLPLFGALINGVIALKDARRGDPCNRPESKANTRFASTSKSIVTLFGVGMPILSFLLSIVTFSIFKDYAMGDKIGPLFPWIEVGGLKIEFAFLIDRLALIMTLVVTGVGSLIHLYSVGYMGHDKAYARYFAYLNLFLFAMLLLVLGESLPLIFIGWEGVGLCSYLLIGFWFTDLEKSKAGMKAFVVNRIGDAGFLIAMFLLFNAAGSLGVLDLAANRELLAPIATLACLALFAGVAGKSAQIPLYIWLPDAMAGPTPVSALIHAATMVTAGVYLMCRMSFLFLLSPVAMEVVATVGAMTALFAALIAITQKDIKKVLAYSTVSQLGYMVMAVGMGAFTAGVFHLMTHAFFKACLFLGAGSVIHGLSGEQDLFKMGGLRKKMPITFITYAAATLAICGIFPFAGFFSKDEILWQAFSHGHTFLWAIGFLTAGLTPFYICRGLSLAFLGKNRSPDLKAHESPISMTIPLIILALLSLVGGWVGIPEAFGGSNVFHHWLMGVFAYPELFNEGAHASHGVELILSLATFLFALHMGLFALILYSRQLHRVESWSKKFGFIHKLLSNKFYVDELYQKVILGPMRLFAEKVLWKTADEKLIDGLFVNGSAHGVGLFGRLLSLTQTGLLQNYALLIGIGAIIMIAVFIL
jgi:NADH-quinone oxidoreductase subunit L